MSEGVILALRYIMTICCALGIVENLLVLAVFAATKRLRIKYYAFILNLALADCLYAVVGTTIPWRVSFVAECVTTGAYTVSILTIFSASINRYLALSIVPPSRYDSMVTGRRVIGACVAMWCIGLAYGLMLFFLSESVATDVRAFGFSFGAFVAWVITAVVYFLAFRKIKQYTPPLASTPGINADTERDHTRVEQMRRLLILFILILVVSFFSWLPYGILALVTYFEPHHFFNTTFLVFVWLGALLYSLSTVINPLLYWWRLDGFKEALYAMLCRCVVKAEPRGTGVDIPGNENTMVDTVL